MAKKQVTVTPVTPEQKPQLRGSNTIKTIPGNLDKGVAELPVQDPGAGKNVQVASTPAGSTGQQSGVPSASPASNVVATDTVPDAKTSYTSQNEGIWGDGGTGQEGYDAQVEAQKQSGGAATAYDDEALRQQLIAAGIDPALLYEYSQKGGYTQNRDTAISGGGTGEAVPFYRDGTWYYFPGVDREVQPGTSGADAAKLSDGSYTYIQYCREMYANATTPEEKAYWHNEAEKIRARAGYSGGADGSMYIPIAQLEGEQASKGDPVDGTTDGTTGNSGGSKYPDTPEGRMQGLLDAWKQAAEDQLKSSIDYAVEQAVKEYERALEDAQVQFKEQAESVSHEERQAMDNAALYAELRGDRGGIGQEQYSSIQNTAAQNRLAVQQAQTKLATDTARAIEDLRVQGEFDKADAMLEITQEYLSQLMAMEQWAAQYNLSVEQFNANLKQWAAEYELTLEQMGISQEQWATEMAFKEKQYDYDAYLNSLGLAHTERSELAETGWMILKMGIVPDQRYLDAMKLDATTAEQMIGMMGSTASSAMSPEEIYQMLYDAGLGSDDRAAAKAYLLSIGMDADLAGAYANAYVDSEYGRLHWSGYGEWGEGWSAKDWQKIMETAEKNLRNKQYNAFNDVNMSKIREKISREQWAELYELLKRYNFNPYDQYSD